MSATTTGRMFRTVTPIDGSVIVERPLASDAEIHATLVRAVEAQRLWRDVPVVERAAICTRAVEWCVTSADELGAELTSQMGRPIAHSPFELRRGFQERGRYMSHIAASALADIEVERSQDFHRFIRRVPLGIVLVLAPWNFPWLTSVNAVIPALLAGNAVILKMAQQTPLVAERYAEAFAAAGMPAGVFQFLHVDHDQVARIIADERIAFVAFTGSVPGGRAVQRAAADRFIGTGLELGGKDAAYVRADVATARSSTPGSRAAPCSAYTSIEVSTTDLWTRRSRSPTPMCWPIRATRPRPWDRWCASTPLNPCAARCRRRFNRVRSLWSIRLAFPRRRKVRHTWRRAFSRR
jgi:acyl-CoA reductase-like NAD-dependent aldehyde dehydrogenase